MAGIARRRGREPGHGRVHQLQDGGGLLPAPPRSGGATRWIRAADDFNRSYGSPHLYILCRLHYGSVLLATGEWAEAERELRAALEKMPKTAEPSLHAEALAKLAELRLAQGRIEEAARLLDGFEDNVATGYAFGAIHLARGELAVAASIARPPRARGRRRLPGSAPRCSSCWCRPRSSRATSGRPPRRPGGSLSSATSLGCDVIVARGERALGRVLVAAADGAGALRAPGASAGGVRAARDAVGGRSHAAAPGARAWSRASGKSRSPRPGPRSAGFEGLGAAGDADSAAAFLRSLGVKAARAGPRGIGVLTKREFEVLRLLGEGLSNREIAERMFITRKTVENHVASVLSKLELRGRGEAAAYARAPPRAPPRLSPDNSAAK